MGFIVWASLLVVLLCGSYVVWEWRNRRPYEIRVIRSGQMVPAHALVRQLQTRHAFDEWQAEQWRLFNAAIDKAVEGAAP